MHRFPYIHAKEEAHRVSFANPLSRAPCLFRLLLPLQVSLLPLLLLPMLPLALLLKREAEIDVRNLSLADLTAIRF